MEKAKLTKAQAEALEGLLRRGYTKEAVLEEKLSDSWVGTFVLNSVEAKTLAIALYHDDGYEVIEEDQVITITPELRKEIQDYFLEREKDDREWMVGWRRGYKDALALLGIKA